MQQPPLAGDDLPHLNLRTAAVLEATLDDAQKAFARVLANKYDASAAASATAAPSAPWGLGGMPTCLSDKK